MSEENSIELPKQVKTLLKMPKKNASVQTSVFTLAQINAMATPTPEDHIGWLEKGGKKFPFVTGGYMRVQLDRIFGFDWDFEVIEVHKFETDVVVQGKLTARTRKNNQDHTITKTQFGGSKIKTKKDGVTPLDIGNDFKAAATDALKKCAAEFGIARDVYYAGEFYETELIQEEIVETKAIEAQTKPLTQEEKDAITKRFSNLEYTQSKQLLKAITGGVEWNAEMPDIEYRLIQNALDGLEQPIEKEETNDK